MCLRGGKGCTWWGWGWGWGWGHSHQFQRVVSKVTYTAALASPAGSRLCSERDRKMELRHLCGAEFFRFAHFCKAEKWDIYITREDEVREFIPMTHDNFFQNCFQTLHHTGKTFVHLYKLLSMSVRLIFIVIEKTSLYLAFLWSRLFCIFLLAWISYASEKRIVNSWKRQERTTAKKLQVNRTKVVEWRWYLPFSFSVALICTT